MYKAIDLAKYIVSKCIGEKCPISNLQLQKILYYIQRDFLRRDEVAFEDAIEAWQFGPVVPKVYYYYSGFGAMPISFVREDHEVLYNDKQNIDAIVETKRKLHPWDMVRDTHQPNGAWAQTYKDGSGNRQVIKRSLIKELG